MAEKQSPSKDGFDRLKNVAFWNWEYQRRNPVYRRWSEVISGYHDFFREVGMFELITSKEWFDGMNEYYNSPEFQEVDTHEAFLNTPYHLHIKENFGEEAWMKHVRYGFLGGNFDKKFHRLWRHHDDGLDTEVALTAILKGQGVKFECSDLKDVTALLKMHSDWLVKISGESPSHLWACFEMNATVPINPNVSLDRLSKVGYEVQVLNMLNKAVLEEFDKQFLDSSTTEAAYQLSIAGKHINNSDVVRLAMLWMWDSAVERNPEDIENQFPEILEQLKERIDTAGLGGEKTFNQFFSRKKRILGYFQRTNLCIQEMSVFNLND